MIKCGIYSSQNPGIRAGIISKGKVKYCFLQYVKRTKNNFVILLKIQEQTLTFDFDLFALQFVKNKTKTP